MMELNQDWMERIYLKIEVNAEAALAEHGKVAA